MLESLSVVIYALREATPNRSPRMRALVLAFHVVVVPDERFELLSAWARQNRHEPSFACASGPVIGTHP